MSSYNIWIKKRQGARDQIVNIYWIIEKAGEFQKKKSTSASLPTLKPLTMWITANCGKFLKRWEYQNTLPSSCEAYMQVKKQHLELDMEQWNNGLVQNWERSTSRPYIDTLLI